MGRRGERREERRREERRREEREEERGEKRGEERGEERGKEERKKKDRCKMFVRVILCGCVSEYTSVREHVCADVCAVALVLRTKNNEV